MPLAVNSRKDHLLNALRRPKQRAHISEMVKDMPLDQLGKLQAMIGELKNGS